MTERRAPLLLVVIGCLGLAAATNGDVLYLAKGGRLEGVVTSETASRVTIDVGVGQVSLPRSSVTRIERGASALATYRTRLEALSPGDLEESIALARFATRNGLKAEALRMWARVSSLDPRNVEAHLALGHVLIGGVYVSEDEANRERGLINFEGRWMTASEQDWLLRDRDRRSADDRRIETARRETRDAEDRARRAEADAARARAEAARSNALPAWGYGSGPVLVGSPHWGGYTAGCSGLACNTVPQIWGQTVPSPPPPAATPRPYVPIRPSSIR